MIIAICSHDHILKQLLCNYNQDEDGDNAFHIAAAAARLIRENLDCIILMLQCPSASIKIRNNRWVKRNVVAYHSFSARVKLEILFSQLILNLCFWSKFIQSFLMLPIITLSILWLNEYACCCVFLWSCICLMGNSGKTLCDLLESLPREWISEELLEALANKGVSLYPTVWVWFFGGIICQF